MEIETTRTEETVRSHLGSSNHCTWQSRCLGLGKDIVEVTKPPLICSRDWDPDAAIICI